MLEDNENNKATESVNLHNWNCYAYLSQIIKEENSFILDKFPNDAADIVQGLREKCNSYDENYKYGDLYANFFTFLEDNIESIYDNPRKCLEQSLGNKSDACEAGNNENKIAALDNFIYAIYHNDNKALEKTFDLISQTILQTTPLSLPIVGRVAAQVAENDSEKLNEMSPSRAGSGWERLLGVIAGDFKVQRISLPTIRNYSYTEGNGMTEYRFGTQAQRHQGTERVSPLFECWLKVLKIKLPKATHLYINNLGLDRVNSSYEGIKEKRLSQQLHDLEDKHDNLVVITLPADKGLMRSSDFTKTDDSLEYEAVHTEFMQIARQNPAYKKVKDFKISEKGRKLLYKNEQGDYRKETEREKLNELIEKSFDVMGMKNVHNLNSAQRQAVWFHFTKFELPNYIIETLKPSSINFSCKHGIDRGGVASAYYNLIKSFDSQKPMSREEFERGLHAARNVPEDLRQLY